MHRTVNCPKEFKNGIEILVDQAVLSNESKQLKCYLDQYK